MQAHHNLCPGCPAGLDTGKCSRSWLVTTHVLGLCSWQDMSRDKPRPAALTCVRPGRTLRTQIMMSLDLFTRTYAVISPHLLHFPVSSQAGHKL